MLFRDYREYQPHSRVIIICLCRGNFSTLYGNDTLQSGNPRMFIVYATYQAAYTCLITNAAHVHLHQRLLPSTLPFYFQSCAA